MRFRPKNLVGVFVAVSVGLLVLGVLLVVRSFSGVPVREQNAVDSSDTVDYPIWSNPLRSRMSWIPDLGRDPSKSSEESTTVVGDGLNASGGSRVDWQMLSLVRLHGEMGWSCRGCGYVLNDLRVRLTTSGHGSKYGIQVESLEGSPVAAMVLDTNSGRTYCYSIDSTFLRTSAETDESFFRRFHGDGTLLGEARLSAELAKMNDPQTLAQFRHFSSAGYGSGENSGVDCFKVATTLGRVQKRSISMEELDVLGLAANIGITSKSCYRRISSGDISFRTRRTGSWRVTSAWNPQGKPVAWNALDTASGFQFPIWFHLDRQACLEQTDSVIPRPSLFRRIFHLQ